MIRPAIRLWLATWRRWTCTLPDATGHPCGTRGYGAATRQEHRLTAHPPLTGRYVCAECHTRHATAEAADRCGQ